MDFKSIFFRANPKDIRNSLNLELSFLFSHLLDRKLSILVYFLINTPCSLCWLEIFVSKMSL